MCSERARPRAVKSSFALQHFIFKPSSAALPGFAALLTAAVSGTPHCSLDHSGENFGSGVAVGSRPPSEPKARKNKTSAWRPNLHSPMKFQLGGPPAVLSHSRTKLWLSLARISHRWSTATPQSSALAVLCSVGLLDVLCKYDCGGLGRKPCQDGPCGASLRQAMRNPG